MMNFGKGMEEDLLKKKEMPEDEPVMEEDDEVSVVPEECMAELEAAGLSREQAEKAYEIISAHMGGGGQSAAEGLV